MTSRSRTTELVVTIGICLIFVYWQFLPPGNQNSAIKDTKATTGWKVLPQKGTPDNVSVSPDGQKLIVTYITNLDSSAWLMKVDDTKMTEGPHQVLEFSPRWHFSLPIVAIARGSASGQKYRLWDLRTNRVDRGSGKDWWLAEDPFAWTPNGRRLIIDGEYIFDPYKSENYNDVKLPWNDRPILKPVKAGSTQVRVLHKGFSLVRLISAPDGRVLAEFKTSQGRFLRIYRSYGNTNNFKQIGEIKGGKNWYPAFGHLLANGRIAFVRCSKYGRNWSAKELWTSTAAGMNALKQLSLPGVDYVDSGNRNEGFSISINGKTIAIIFNGKAYIKRLDKPIR